MTHAASTTRPRSSIAYEQRLSVVGHQACATMTNKRFMPEVRHRLRGKYTESPSHSAYAAVETTISCWCGPRIDWHSVVVRRGSRCGCAVRAADDSPSRSAHLPSSQYPLGDTETDAPAIDDETSRSFPTCLNGVLLAVIHVDGVG